MNEPLGEREILCVSQFTLYGDTRRGNRPSFVAAAPGERAEPLYERFCELTGRPPRRVRRLHAGRPAQRRARDPAARVLAVEPCLERAPRPAQRWAQPCSGPSSSSSSRPSSLST